MGCTRRGFLAGAAAAGLLTGPALGRRRERTTVAVFGGGVAGMTAAHELALRGFDVTLYERRIWGGKCFSSQVPGTAAGGRRPLPGEHAYRVPFGFYRNLPDTMKRIPHAGASVFENLVPTQENTFMFSRPGRSDFTLPLANSAAGLPYYSAEQVEDTLRAFALGLAIPPEAAEHLVRRIVTFLSSCDARRATDWEAISWLEFVGGDRYGLDYRRSVAALPQFTQASKADETAANYIAHFLEQMVYANMGRGANGPAVRVLDGPTQEVWIDPWVAELDRLGVKLRLHHELRGLDVAGGRIAAASVRTPRGRRRVQADHFVLALPVERARRLWTRDILALDPSLANMEKLGVDWMNGISFFLNERRDLQDGIFICCDSPWAVSAIPQAQFWEQDFAATWGDGAAVDKLSAAIADWRTPGDFVRKRADECTPDEVVEETWEQIKAHINEPGRPPVLTDAMLHSYEVDPGMRLRDGRLVSGDPLVLPTKGTRRFRPSPATKVPNLMLCGDYLSREWIITTMESACESGRQAANAVLDASGSAETPATVFRTYRPPEWEPLKRADADRHARGEKHVLDG